MLANKLIKGGGAATPTDPQFPYVTMLLHGDGTNGAQNNTFLDASANAFTITRNGNTTQGSFSPYGDNWSNYFVKASTSYLLTPLNGFAGNFTIEAWIYPLSNDTTIYSGGGSAVHEYFMIRGGGTNIEVELQSGYGGANYYPVQGFNLLNRWTHVALVRSGSTVKCYFDGVASATTMSMAASAFPTSSNKIGTYSANPTSYGFDGYISNLRVFDATAFYTANFTPPTAPLTAIAGTSLLTCQSNRFKDASANNFTITRNGDVSVQRFSPFAPTAEYSASVIGGSGYFDGTGDWLQTPSNSAFNLSSGAYSLELFVFFNSVSGSSVNVLFGFSGAATTGYPHLLLSSNVLYWQTRGGGANETSVSWAPSAGQWYHIAVGWNGSNSLAIWINGTRVATNTVTPTSTGQNGLNIGGASDGYSINGYLSNARLVKGSDVYGVGNSTITVPTSPLTAITNTSLLLSMTNAGIYDNAMMADLETVGNAQVSTTQKKFGTGSMKFDGTGDWLVAPNSPNLSFNTGDFTIEFWLYLNTTAVEQWFVSWTGPGYCTIYLNSGTIRWYANGGLRITGASLSTTTWYHIALTRENGSTKLFVNGTQSGSTYADTNSYVPTAFTIGASPVATAPLNGYIDDLRITKGYARYTSNFTPPTAAFPNQ